MKQKKILLILAVAFLVAALVLAVTAVVIRRNSRQLPGEQTSIAYQDVHIKINKAYRKQYEAVSSYNIAGIPDENIKKAVFNRFIDKTQTLVRFDLLKTYGAFRIFDAQTQTAGNQEKCLLVVYAQGDKAVLFQTLAYQTTAQRADALTKQIEAFDKDYTKLVKAASGLDKSLQLY